MDGWVTIGTKLDNKQLEKDLKDAEKRLQQFERESERLTKQQTKAKIDLEDYYKQKELIKSSTDKMLEQAETEEHVNSVLELEKVNLQQLNEAYAKQLNNLEEVNKKIQENAHKQALVKNEIQETTEKLNQVKGFNNIKNSIEDIGKSVTGVTKKVGRWALAVLSIRSAYLFVRQAMNTLSEYNDDLANKVSNIRLVLATALEPIINRIISLVITLLNYLNYLTTAWFGLNLFARASELSSKKMADNLASGAGSAREIKKQLAGFDEMNVLQDNDASGGGGGAGGSADIPEFNLPEVEIPEWLKWLADHKDELIAGILGIATALSLIKLGIDLITATGIGLLIGGIVYAVLGLLEYLKDPTWENFGQIIQGIGIAVIGIGIAFLGLPAIIAGVVILIWGTIVKYWDQIQAFLQKGVDWLKGKSDWIHKVFGDTVGKMYDNAVEVIQGILDWAGRMMSGIKANFDEIIKFVKNVFAGNWKGAWDNVKNIFKNIWTSMKDTAVTVFNSILALGKNIAIGVGNAISNVFKGVVNAVLWSIENVLNSPIRTINNLIGVINKLPGINLGKLPTFNLPRLAKGGIINMPGKGIPVGNAIAGERGREAVLPLTDSQQMALLGEAIGKYITINANITNTMNGRVISRELQKINGESDFAFNR